MSSRALLARRWRMKTRARSPMEHTLLGPRRGRHLHGLGPILSLGALLVLGLAGCGASVSLSSAARAAPTATAPATAMPVATATPTPVITPAPSAGWAVYRDPRFAFQVPIPSGWQPASLIWPPQPESNGFNYYMVQFFPPGPHGEPGAGASAKAPELIQISVTLSGPFTSSLAQNTGFTREAGTVALGGEQVPLYDRGQPGYGSSILRAAETTLGTYPMLFEMHYNAVGAWDPAIAQRDISLYLAMMQGFKPAGN